MTRWDHVEEAVERLAAASEFDRLHRFGMAADLFDG